ncbi:MAG: hypothetical protein ABSH49_15590 [Bryobacteraceae bacterium]|jgi:hypothetical protein
MALYWDQCQVNITNNTTSPMTYSSSSTSDGFLIDNPGNIGAGPGATGSFKGSSSSGNASDGCAGTVTYSLTDGTLVNVNYKTSYYYGPSNNSSYTCGFQGPRGNLYTNKTNSVDTQGSNGGAGKRVTWTLSVDYVT